MGGYRYDLSQIVKDMTDQEKADMATNYLTNIGKKDKGYELSKEQLDNIELCILRVKETPENVTAREATLFIKNIVEVRIVSDERKIE